MAGYRHLGLQVRRDPVVGQDQVLADVRHSLGRGVRLGLLVDRRQGRLGRAGVTVMPACCASSSYFWNRISQVSVSWVASAELNWNRLAYGLTAWLRLVTSVARVAIVIRRCPRSPPSQT